MSGDRTVTLCACAANPFVIALFLKFPQSITIISFKVNRVFLRYTKSDGSARRFHSKPIC